MVLGNKATLVRIIKSCVIAYFIFSTSPANSQNIYELDQQNDLNDVHITNENISWMVGRDGTVLKINKSSEPTRIDLKTNKWLKSIYFTNANEGWIVGSDGVVYHTKDKGDTWTKQESNVEKSLRGVYFFGSQHGWIVGNDGLILSTSNGGKDWKKRYFNESIILESVYALDSKNVWIVGNKGTVINTFDGGETWNKIKYTGNWLRSIYFVDNQHGWIVGQNGTILKTDDGGKTWDKQVSGTKKWLNDVFFVSKNEGWCVGDNGLILETNNGGSTWIPKESNTSNFLRGIYYKESGIVVGEASMAFNFSKDELKYFVPSNDKKLSEKKLSRPPDIKVSDPIYRDSNGDNRLEGKENATITFVLSNEGEGPAKNIQISGNTNSAIEGLKAQVGNIKPGEKRSISLTLRGEKHIQDGEAEITFNFTEASGFEPAPIRLTIPTLAYRPPNLKITDVAAEDDQGRGIIKPGIVVNITVRVQNKGVGTAENVKVSLRAGDNIFIGGKERGTYSETIGKLESGDWHDISFEAFSNNRAESFAINATVEESNGKYGVADQSLGLEMDEQQLTMRELEIKGQEIEENRNREAPSLKVDIENNIPKTNDINSDAIAVIIGNQNYRGDTPDVAYALRDVSMMREYLQTTFGFKPGNILYYENASLGDMRTLFGTESGPGRIQDLVHDGESDVFVFYSGHGAPSTDDGTGYLMPVDGNTNNLDATGYKLDLLYENLSKINSNSTTVVIDACFSGASGSGEMLINKASPIGIKVNNPAENLGDDVVVVAAASGSQIASWYTEKRYGLLTYFFLKGVKGNADLNGDKKITVGELRKYLTDSSDGLPYKARALYGREQIPQVFGNDNKVVLELD